MKKLLLLAAMAAMAAAPSAAFACSACGCNLDTDEPMADTSSPDKSKTDLWKGLSVDERVDYVNQDTLWNSMGKATAAMTNPTVGDQHEVQTNTTTVWYTTTFDYKSSGAWGANVAIPFQYRTHGTYNTGDWSESKSEWNQLSDIRAIGRYALTDDKTFNILAGIKLPTGSTWQRFDTGNAAGTQVDRGLQPGTGTWDVLLGLNQGGSLPAWTSWSSRLSWFAQEMWQKPLEQNNGFAEGEKFNTSVGLRYTINETFTPQFQLNDQVRRRDRGQNADILNSGGQTLNATPGLFVNLSPSTTVYGFVQIPIYQQVGGLELVPDYSASLGIKYRF